MALNKRFKDPAYRLGQIYFPLLNRYDVQLDRNEEKCVNRSLTFILLQYELLRTVLLIENNQK